MTEKHHVAVLLQRTDDAGHHFNGKTVAEVGQDQADEVGSAGAQVGGGNIVHVAQLLYRGLDSVDSGAGNFSFLAQHQRYRGDRHSGQLSYVYDADFSNSLL